MEVKDVKNTHKIMFISLLLVTLGEFQGPVDGRYIESTSSSSSFIPRPRHEDAAAFARWLASQSSWGVLSTISSDLGGSPFGNVVSFSDGLPEKGKGIPFFYLTMLDPTARYALKDQRSSFTISEYPIGTCGSKDPENPSCAKMTLTGKLHLVDGKSKEAEFAQTALFTKHPEMKDCSCRRLKMQTVVKKVTKIHFLVISSVLFILGSFQEHVCVYGRPLQSILPLPRPRPDDAAPFARWLVSQSSWGVLSTIASDLGGAPFGNVVSFSDGQPDKGRGIPYFYLTTLDPTASYALKDQRSSFTISEYSIGTCGSKDPENPSCAKITLIGKLELLDENSDKGKFAQAALFTKHPEMEGWPKGHDFHIFKLEIDDIFLINWFGGPKPLTVDQYLKINM